MVSKNLTSIEALIDALSGDLDSRTIRGQRIFKLRLEKEFDDRIDLNFELYEDHQTLYSENANDILVIDKLRIQYELMELYEFCQICKDMYEIYKCLYT